MALSDMGNASNEKREQNIMMLQGGYNQLKYATLEQAVQLLGYTAGTIKKWAKDGNVPLIIDNTHTVVPFNDDNKPSRLKDAKTPGDVFLAVMRAKAKIKK